MRPRTFFPPLGRGGRESAPCYFRLWGDRTNAAVPARDEGRRQRGTNRAGTSDDRSCRTPGCETVGVNRAAEIPEHATPRNGIDRDSAHERAEG